DLVGEKLAEPHVRGVLDRLWAELGVAPRFALLVPVPGQPPRYRLYLQGVGEKEAVREAVQASLHAGLEENPYYPQAVGLGQLAPAEVRVLPRDGGDAWRVYERRCLARGQKIGDVKPTVLDAWTGWPEEFARVRPALVPQ